MNDNKGQKGSKGPFCPLLANLLQIMDGLSKESIGVIDSGVGGITVWAEIVRLMPDIDIIYYADTANCPYGLRSDEQIIALTRNCVDRLIEHGVGIIVLACNTITAAAVDVLRSSYGGIQFVGMEPAVKPAALATISGVVGILATRATLRGKLYLDTSHRWAEGVKLIETAGDGLVEMVENGQVDTAECDNLLLSYIEPMIEQGADQVVLGCTHYPFLSPSIKRLSRGKLNVVQPAKAVAARASQLIGYHDMVSHPKSLQELSHGLGEQYIFISSVPGRPEIERIETLALSYYQSIL